MLLGCSYSTSNEKIPTNCNIFDPVVTDLGICYSFNAEPVTSMLTKSSFKNAFQEVYQFDLNESPIELAKGAGDNFALKFLVYNHRYQKAASETRPFKTLISSQRGYFDALSVSKEVKFGFETTYDVLPTEVKGTRELQSMLEEKRKCRFSDEVHKKDRLFKTYSQSSCEFECRVHKAREECKCTPWNFPTPPSMPNPIICDLYGNFCFHKKMRNVEVIGNCTNGICPSDCEDIRFNTAWS